MMNMVMRHHAQNSSIVFAKKSLQDMPITINELREHMENVPHSHLADRLMRLIQLQLVQGLIGKSVELN